MSLVAPKNTFAFRGFAKLKYLQVLNRHTKRIHTEATKCSTIREIYCLSKQGYSSSHPEYRTNSSRSDSSFSDKISVDDDSTSIDADPGGADFLSNDGIIVGIWMFSRHGDRTPSKPLTPDHRINDEASYWVSKLPIPNTCTVYENYCQYYPVVLLNPPVSLTNPNATKTSDHFMDVKRNPFGFITDIGLRQLCENGRRFFNRYYKLGYNSNASNSRANISNEAMDDNDSDNTFDQKHRVKEFLSIWDIKVYSTNYLRTVMSVQSFLDGMLETDCYPYRDNFQSTKLTSSAESVVSPSSKSDMKTVQTQPDQVHLENLNGKRLRLHDPRITKEIQVPSHSTPIKAVEYENLQQKQNEDKCSRQQSLIPIHIRDTSNDPLNAFDRNPGLIAELISEVVLSNHFIQIDGSAATLAAKLANILPGLTSQQSIKNPSNPTVSHQSSSAKEIPKKKYDFAKRTPSGINWVEAADHFVCRSAHDVPLTSFTDHEHEDQIEQTLQAMSYQVRAHLSWRFRQWYQNTKLLAEIAAPPLREILNQMKSIPHMGTDERRPFVIYSCHDITILGLLYGIGADFLADDESAKWRYWPPYASNLVFELIRVPSEIVAKTYNDKSNLTESEKHFVRILLNGKPVTTVDLNATSKTKMPHFTGSGPQSLLSIEDFEVIVSKLEEAGRQT